MRERSRDRRDCSVPNFVYLFIIFITQDAKAEDPMLFNNYRPVSLLSIFSKIFEKMMYKRLVEFLEKQQILYSKQFGFRKKHSTYMPIMLLVDKLVRAMEKGEFVLGIFLDFSKAFDTVDHKILFEKLEYCGIRGTALDWFVSYLDNRQQYVTFEFFKLSDGYK